MSCKLLFLLVPHRKFPHSCYSSPLSLQKNTSLNALDDSLAQNFRPRCQYLLVLRVWALEPEIFKSCFVSIVTNILYYCSCLIKNENRGDICLSIGFLPLLFHWPIRLCGKISCSLTFLAFPADFEGKVVLTYNQKDAAHIKLKAAIRNPNIGKIWKIREFFKRKRESTQYDKQYYWVEVQ